VLALLVILGLVAAAVPPITGGGSPRRRVCSNRRAYWSPAMRYASSMRATATPTCALAQVIDGLVRQRAQLRGDIAAKVEEASRNVEQGEAGSRR
jgi:hypothetical protein